MSLMINDDENDINGSPFRSETVVPGTYSTNHGVNQVRELCTPVVLVNIFHF
jgi:hypothetical protein